LTVAFMAQGMTRLVTDLAEQFRHLSVSGLELAEIGEQHWRQEEIAGAQPLTNNGNSFRADRFSARTLGRLKTRLWASSTTS